MEQVADLGLLVERGFDLGERVFQVPVLVGKRKRGPDLLEAGSVLPISQESIGLQGGWERKTPRVEIRCRCRGKKSCPGPLICRKAVSRKVPAPRGLDQVGRKPLDVTALEPTFLIFHKHGGILHSWSSFAITGVMRVYKDPQGGNSFYRRGKARKLANRVSLIVKYSCCQYDRD
jgi:hypothetical protein